MYITTFVMDQLD